MENEIIQLYNDRHALTEEQKKRIEEIIASENLNIALNKDCADCWADAIVQIAIAKEIKLNRPTPTASGNYTYNGRQPFTWYPYGIEISANTSDEVIEEFIKIPCYVDFYTRVKQSTEQSENGPQNAKKGGE